MPLDQDAIESAVEEWLKRSTGLTELTSRGSLARIGPADSKFPQPPYPYILYRVSVPRQTYGHDEMRKSYDQGAPNGSEVVYTLRGSREFIVSLQAYSFPATGGKDPKGFYTAKTYLDMALQALDLPSISDAIYNIARMVYVDMEASNDLSAALGPIGQGRATMDVRFRTVETISERTGYIEKVHPITFTMLAGSVLSLEVTTILSARAV